MTVGVIGYGNIGTKVVRLPWDNSGTADKNPASWPWQLYDLSKDWTQYNDVSAQYPEKVKELEAIFCAEAEKYDVYPVGGSLGTHLKRAGWDGVIIRAPAYVDQERLADRARTLIGTLVVTQRGDGGWNWTPQTRQDSDERIGACNDERRFRQRHILWHIGPIGHEQAHRNADREKCLANRNEYGPAVDL